MRQVWHLSAASSPSAEMLGKFECDRKPKMMSCDHLTKFYSYLLLLLPSACSLPLALSVRPERIAVLDQETGLHPTQKPHSPEPLRCHANQPMADFPPRYTRGPGTPPTGQPCGRKDRLLPLPPLLPPPPAQTPNSTGGFLSLRWAPFTSTKFAMGGRKENLEIHRRVLRNTGKRSCWEEANIYVNH